MASLDDKWIWDGFYDCPVDRTNSPKHLSLSNLEGIFIMIVCGVAVGIVLITIEISYAKYYYKGQTFPTIGEEQQRFHARKTMKKKMKQQVVTEWESLSLSKQAKDEECLAMSRAAVSSQVIILSL